MALVLKDRVREQSTTSGTGSITLAGAYTGYQSFASAVTSGSTVYYTIHNTTAPNDGEWEVGVGTFTSPSTLTRDTVFSSSTGGTKVSFSGSSVLEVFITQPAEQAVYINQATGSVEVFGNGTNTVAFTNINASNVVMVSGTISTNAANATDITNKTYVDGLFSTGISYHDPVLVESPTALNAVYVQPNGAGNGVGATLTNNGANAALVVDGVTLSNTARVLVYQQSNAVQNGIYTVTNPGNTSAQWVLTRAADANTYGLADPNKLGQGDAVFVQSGNTGAGETYICNTPGTIIFGSTNITFAQISSAQVYSAGTGLNLSNLTFSIANTAVTAATYGNAGEVPQIAVNAQGQITSASNVSINASSITLGTLDNARTTASASNGANTIVLRDSTGSFAANTITATTSNAITFNGTTGNFTNITANGAGLTAINASNISSGTIANARTTGSTSNSANTIVLRDASGNFGSNVISASLFSGDGSGINAINASNISSGTIANARTTASTSNGASTIVQRDSGGNFSANTVTAAVIGDLSGGSNINASNISSGTIANARTTASSSNGSSTIVLRDAGGAFAAGAITATSLSGNGSAITAINASAITTGTIDNARTTASSANGASTIVARDAGGNFSANTITATTFSGAFSGGAINATSITDSGNLTFTGTGNRITGDFNNATIANRPLFQSSVTNNSSTVGVMPNGTSTVSAWNTYNNSDPNNSSIGNLRISSTDVRIESTTSGTGTALPITMFTGGSERVRIFTSGGVSIGNTTDPGATNLSVTGTIAGNGAPLTGINASNIASGTIANARTTAASANGTSTIVARDAGGNFAAATITATTFSGAHSGDGSALTNINASNISSGTIANARTTAATANGASTIVLRGTSGEFSAGAITATSFTGDGSALSAINASNLSSGTVASARISGSYTGITGVGTLTAGTWNATTIAQANGGTGFTTGYRLFQSEFTSNINANTNRTVGAYGSYASAATNTPTTSGILYNFTSGSDGSADGGQFWQDYVTNNLYLRQRWGGTYGSWTQFVTTAGTGASGTWSINVTGSAGSATTATTATNLSGGTVSATTISASGGYTATSAAPFYTNATTVSSNYTVQANFNAMSAGPITINTGVTVTVSTGSSWVIV